MWEKEVPFKEKGHSDSNQELKGTPRPFWQQDTHEQDYHELVHKLFDKEKEQHKLDDCCVVQCKPLKWTLPTLPLCADNTNSMVRSNKVQLAETIRSLFGDHSVR